MIHKKECKERFLVCPKQNNGILPKTRRAS